MYFKSFELFTLLFKKRYSCDEVLQPVSSNIQTWSEFVLGSTLILQAPLQNSFLGGCMDADHSVGLQTITPTELQASMALHR